MDASLITFGADAPNAALTRTLEESGVHALPIMQRLVRGVEFGAGCALVVGLLSALAASGLFVVCVSAFALDARKRVSAWQPIDRADWLGDVLYLPEARYRVGLAVVMLAGPGPWSLDALIPDRLAR